MTAHDPVKSMPTIKRNTHPEVARRAAKSIREGMQILRDQPGVGRPVDDMEPEFREWFITFGDSGYVSLYRFDGATAVILAIRHQREAGY